MSNLGHVVFIHLGDGRPKHLFPNILRVRSQVANLDLNVILIGSNERLLREAQERGIQALKYTATPEVELLLQSHKNQFDHNFRDGFWRFSIERLFALSTIFEEFENTSALHIESDILTLNNFPYEKIFTLKNITWCKMNQETDVASLLYIPSREKAVTFKSHLQQILTENISLTDMSALAQLGNESTKIDYFPAAENPQSRYLNRKNLSESNAERVTKLYKKFDGIFDSAPLGMFVLGQDPRNNWGLVRRQIELEHSGIVAGRFQLNLTQNGLLKSSDGVDIFCLHAHSKEIQLFGKESEQYLRRIVKRGNSRFSKTTFSVTAFLDLIADYKKRRKLLVLAINFPPIKGIRNTRLIGAVESRFRLKIGKTKNQDPLRPNS
jgi:hypothetical protein